jgi:hypothetical protein
MAKHLPDAFPFQTRDGKAVVDEQCSCGHKRSQHEDRFSLGHGYCLDCNCKQFTWTKWIYEKEV